MERNKSQSEIHWVQIVTLHGEELLEGQISIKIKVNVTRVCFDSTARTEI